MIHEIHMNVSDSVRNALHAFHDTQGRDTSAMQSVRGGTQISLLQCPDKGVRELLDDIRWATIEEFGPCEMQGAWSIRMHKGGGHIPHNHPKGWISGVVYVDVPDQESALLQFDGAGITVKPEPGKMVLFPSFLSHGTTAYLGDKPRLTVAFDMVKHEA